MAPGPIAEQPPPTLSVDEKDRWWLDNVYQSNTRQMTLRVVVWGFLLGGALAITNLYVGAKIGVTLGTSITSVVLTFVCIDALRRIVLGRRFHFLEGAILQSIACSAGYMASPLTASMAAYMVVTNTIVPPWQLVLWLLGIAFMGVLFAIPLKRRFINNEQLPFPEGRACGVLLTMLRDDENPPDHDDGQRATGPPHQTSVAARLLGYAALVGGLIRFFQSQAALVKLRLGFLAIPESPDAWYYRAAIKHGLWLPTLSGAPLRELTIRPTLDIAVLALGGLMGIRTCMSVMIGAILNYCLLAPWMIHRGDIVTQVSAEGSITVGFRAITTWSLWCGAAIMTSAALWSFFADRHLLANALHVIADRRRDYSGDPLGRIEIPLWVFFAGLPIAGGAVIWMANCFFGVALWLGIVSIPLVFFLTIIAVNATALTSMTPHGALGKLTQLACGILAPRNITSNIVAASVSAEVANQASNFIQNIKPGYMVGAKPRLQAIGHLIGAVSGALAAVAVFYAVFLRDGPASLIRPEYPFPAVVVWKAVAEAMTGGLNSLPNSAIIAALAGVLVGILMELFRAKSKGGFAVSPIGFGLAFVIPFDISLAMFMGALFFWLCGKRQSGTGSRMAGLVARNQEAICAGAVTGAAIVGMGVIAIEAL